MSDAKYSITLSFPWTLGNYCQSCSWWRAVARLKPKLERFLKARDIPFRFFETKRPGHAVDLVGEAIVEGFRNIGSFGGDGTHHEVVNGMCLQKHVAMQDLLFAALPAGTGNDWIKQHGIPKDLRKAVSVLSEGQKGMQTLGMATYHDSEGVLKQRVFMNVAGAAYDADVVLDLLNVKRQSSLVYLLRGLQNLVNYKGMICKVQYDDQFWSGRIFTLHGGLCRYSGGGMQFVPHASPEGPGLAMTILPFRSLRVLLSQVPRLYNGRISGFPGSVTATCSEIMLESDDSIGLEADGEFLGYSPFTLREAPQKLHFIGVG